MWMKVDDKLHDHPKVHTLLEQGRGEALFLWLLAGSWCGDGMTDGVVSGFVLGRWDPDWRTHADWLVEAGLWEPFPRADGRPAFAFHDWLNYNDSRAKIMADRKANAIRKLVYADTELVTAVKARDRDRCRYCGCLVKWSDRRSAGGGTFDHVQPIKLGGKNTLTNLVVACRGCNGRKADADGNNITLTEAGMRLLKPGSMGAPDFDDADETAPGGSSSGTKSPGVDGRVGSGRVGGQNRPSSGSSSTDDHETDETDKPTDPEADR